MDIFEKERAHYPVLRDCVYVNHATTGLIPTYSRDAMVEFLENRTAHGMSMGEFIATWGYCDAMRPDLGAMFGCSGDEIVFGASHSWLFNIFMNGIDLKPGDNIITTELSHSSVNYLCMHTESRGAEPRFVKPAEGATRPEDIFALVDGKTRAICLCLVENKYGFRHDIKAVSDFCREKGILLAVDATQAAGVLNINVKEMGIDFMTTSCYKWMQGLYGVGFAYVSRDLMPQLKHVDMGWTGSKDRHHLNPMKLNLSEGANRFECGGISFVGMIGVSKTIRRYLELGADAIENRVMGMVNAFYEQAAGLRSIRIYGNFREENRSSIITLAFPESLGITNETLAKNGIAAHCSSPGLMRLGFHYQNTNDDVARVLAYLASAES